MGMFDDLIPGGGIGTAPPLPSGKAAGGGMFDDLVPGGAPSGPGADGIGSNGRLHITITPTPSTADKAYAAGQQEVRDIQAQARQRQSPSVVADVVKSIPTGVARGWSNLAADTNKGLAAESFALGIDPSLEHLDEGLNKGPTAADAMRGIEQITGPLHQPETMPGKLAASAAEFAGNPITYASPGGAAGNFFRAVVGGVGSELAGEAAEGTRFEAPARIGGAFLAGGRDMLRRPAKAAVPTTEELYDAASAGYNAARGYGVELHPVPVARLADDIASDLHNDGFRALNAPKTFAAIDELKNPAGKNVAIGDIEAVRKVLNRAGANPLDGAEREASRRAISAIDDYVGNLDPSHVVVNPQFAGRVADELSAARGNYAAAKRADLIAGKEDAADRQAAVTGSGANINNALRQKINSILDSPTQRRGFSQDELDQMRRIVDGTFTGNAARLLGKLAPTGVVSGSLGLEIGSHLLGGPAGLSAVPIVGAVAKKIGDASTRRQVSALDEMVRSRSPLGQSNQAAVPQPTPRAVPPVLPALTHQSGAPAPFDLGRQFVTSDADNRDGARMLARMSPDDRAQFAQGFTSALVDALNQADDRSSVISNAFLNSPASKARITLALGPDGARETEMSLRLANMADNVRRAGLSPDALADVLATRTQGRIDDRTARDLVSAIGSRDHNAGAALAQKLARSPRLMDGIRRADAVLERGPVLAQGRSR